MIYTDGKATIANRREDTRRKVQPHEEYATIQVLNAFDRAEALDETVTLADIRLFTRFDLYRS